jgi:hypothetical protein
MIYLRGGLEIVPSSGNRFLHQIASPAYLLGLVPFPTWAALLPEGGLFFANRLPLTPKPAIACDGLSRRT